MFRKNLNSQWIISLIKRKQIRWTSISQKSTSSSDNGIPADVEKIRNIGILAHIDAGKTTTTERMLYYSGTTRHLGDVDDGDTVTDYMPQERDRGITITSAAVTFPWKDHRINLIDTPGHVDFTMEVERCLRVLDGAVAVLDASAGVEAQTLTVWDQANHHGIPRIGFLNKMDKPAANVDMCLTSIRDKLNTTPLLLQLPVMESKVLVGVIDLVSMETVTWPAPSKGIDDGSRLNHCPLSESQDTGIINQANDARVDLVEQVADLNDEFADKILSSPSFNPLHISSQDLMRAIRNVTFHQRGLPILCGSSLKNKGVQLLMDAVNNYLPSPLYNKDPLVEVYGKDLCAYAFKIIHDKQRGPLIFLRVYSGILKPQSAIYNASRNCTERVSRLLYVMADSYQEVTSVPAGNIAVAVGLKQTVTGDTIVASKAAYNIAKKKHSHQAPLLEPIKVPEPVFFCTIEPPSQAYQADLERALERLHREDPSLQVKTDDDTGQLILSGMGELHLDIIQDRIRKEYKIDVELGPLQISYRETISGTATASTTLDKVIGDKHHLARVTVSVEPLDDHNKPVYVTVLDSDGKKDDEMQEAVKDGALSACRQGPLLGFPVLGVAVTVDKYSVIPGTSPTMLAACVSQATHNALQQATASLLEPIMNMEITTSEERLQVVLGDVARRRGQVLAVENRMGTKVVSAATPLAEMMGYSTALRSLTSGTASCSLEFSNYQQMSFMEQESVIQKLTGYS
ncbi:ribosome-releasing factor 2, mitochondrial-like [Lytechinus variegatus]|uniref:ribosome-releasing factor 2, mitochondrial-like n=1 Tax=Lytechinus variegatus TaxID=7654 RepID=UPI001BB2733C|nr:ribosome-releasing factor 2, mitochondrial-like [Lytechinus variegatus]